MADRSNARLNEAIEQHIAQWDGTVHGFCIKNMWENGADYESIAFRLVCFDCYEKLMAKGYDGQYYDEADECLDEDY